MAVLQVCYRRFPPVIFRKLKRGPYEAVALTFQEALERCIALMQNDSVSYAQAGIDAGCNVFHHLGSPLTLGLNMLKLLQLMLLVWVAFPALVFADNSAGRCSRFPEVAKSTRTSCDCGNNLAAKYPVTDETGYRLVRAPTAMRLVAVCDYRKSEHGSPYGSFFYRGKVRVSGVISSEENVVQGGDAMYFNGKPFGGVWVPGDRETRLLLRMPPVSPRYPCGSRKVSIEVTHYAEGLGPGTDEDGGMILQFKPLQLGPYKKCATK